MATVSVYPVGMGALREENVRNETYEHTAVSIEINVSLEMCLLWRSLKSSADINLTTHSTNI